MLVPAVAKLSSEDSQRVIEPVYPPNVKVVEFVPVQTVALPAIVPPTDAGETVTVAETLFAAAQTPLVITALYEVVAVRLVAVKEVVVLAMAVPAVAKLSREDSQRVIEPVYPLNVKVVEFVPVQTVALPAIVPPTDTGETVTVAEALFAVAQTLLLMIAL